MPRTEQTIFTFHQKKRPYLILGRKSRRVHFAKSKVRAKPVYITNAYSRQLVHKWRSEEQAILWERKQSLMITLKLDVRLDWQPCPNRFRSKQSPTKKSHVLDNQIKLSFFTKRQIPTKKTLPLLSSILKKHSNSIDRCTV
jgi:diaminohydroxyphosphoribosylaminopyrimidine deaminase/5-amino-6-(5-phosphoribosylamino)uracil reductase